MSVPRFLGLWLQIVLVLGAALLFRLEELHGLARILPLVAVGFAVHAWLPRRFQLPFFCALSGGALLAVLGPEAGSQVIAIGLGLLGLCHLPLPLRARVALLCAAGIALAVLRLYASPRWAAQIFPILGAMFMFRLLVYVYDTHHERTPASPWERIAYFFLLPNACFPIFPIVDYATFRRTYGQREAWLVGQRGVESMLRGVSHLVLYRVVYQHWTPSPDAVHDLPGLLQMMATSYCQLLRISGQFHLAIGMLQIFGFDLPRPQHFYFLASSFTDYWRRANVYWRDFMVKLFLYPAFLRLRHAGVGQPMLWATLWVFAVSWVLHSYQWFWLLGSFPVKLSDFVFWGLFGVLVAGNALWESARRRRRPRGPVSWGSAFLHAGQVVGVFATVCVLWSFWTTDSWADWLYLMSQARHTDAAELAGLAALLVAVLGSLAAGRRWTSGRPRAAEERSPARAGALTAATAAVLVALGLPPVQAALGEAGAWVASAAEPGLNRADRERFVAGYYAELQSSHRLGNPLWSWEGLRVQEQVVTKKILRMRVDEPIGWRVRPNLTDGGADGVSTNRWGMRDGDYTLEPAPGGYRIALHGASPEMGSGVRDSDVFEAQLEEALNREHAGGRFERYEVLNFAVGGHAPLDHFYMLRTTSLRFRPDAVFYVAHEKEAERLAEDVLRWYGRGYEPDEPLAGILREAGITPELPEVEAQRRFWPIHQRLLAALYREFATSVREQGAVPVWVFVRLPFQAHKRQGVPDTEAIAREAGFTTLLLHDLFEGLDPGAYQISRTDKHPTPEAHAMIAEALLEKMRQHDAALGAGLAGRSRADPRGDHGRDDRGDGGGLPPERGPAGRAGE